MKFKILFKALSGLVISSSLFPVVMSLNRTHTHTHTQDSLSVGNSNQGNDIEWNITDDGVLSPKEGTTIPSNLLIPKAVNNASGQSIKVTAIKDRAFQNCENLVSVEFKEGVTINTFGEGAFKNCVKLSSFEIPKTVTLIGEECFYGCTSLTTLSFEEKSNIEIISNKAFYECLNLKSVNFPDSLKEIQNAAFWSCTSLTKISFGENSHLITIGDLDATPGVSGTFAFCSNLKDITLPNSLKFLGHTTFGHCSSLKEINIPNSVVAISSLAFELCSSLTKINIPKNVFTYKRDQYTYIYWDIFKGCNILKDIYLNWDESTLDDIIIPKIKNGDIRGLFLDEVTTRSTGNETYDNKLNATIHIDKNASDELLKKYQDNFKEYDEKIRNGVGLDLPIEQGGTTIWKRDIDNGNNNHNILGPVLGAVFGGIVFSGLSVWAFLLLKTKRNKSKKK